MANNQMAPARRAPAEQVTEVYDEMRGFLKSTHWSKPYYSALAHNNPQLPYHLLEHVNCTYLSTPGRPPTLLALKQHAQSLAVLISMLAPAQYGGTLEPPNEGKINGDAPFAAEQAFDWLNDLESHYNTEDAAHKKPLNALLNLVKSNSDTEGPKWHCPLEKTGIELAEKHPYQQYRPYESHITLLMHANEILERLDHEYSAMGGILGILPLDSDKVAEQKALTQAKSTLVGQWILYTQHLVVRMHELEIAYGNCLDLLANEAIVPMQNVSIHGPDGRSGREIVFPQDRWVLANAGEDVFTFIHQMLDRAEAHQNAQDDVFAEQKVLGDAAFTSNDEAKYRGIVKVDLNTRFYRLRNSGHGPLFVLPAFGDRTNTQHTRDMENRPTVVTIPQPSSKETVSSWEAKHKGTDTKVIHLTIEKNNLEAKLAQSKTSIEMRDREIQRLRELQRQYDDKVNNGDKDLAKEVVRLGENIEYMRMAAQKGEERERTLQAEIDTFKQANINSQNGVNPINVLVDKVNEQQSQIRGLRNEIKERDKKIDDLNRAADMQRILNGSLSHKNPALGNPEQVSELQTQLSICQKERQMLQQEIQNLKQSKTVKGKILNFPAGFKLEYGSTFEDTNLGIIACSSVFYKSLLEAERQRNSQQQKLDESILSRHAIQAQLDQCKAENERLRIDNTDLRQKGNTAKPSKIINIPWKLQYTSTFRDDNQGLIVLTTEWYDYLIATERTVNSHTAEIQSLQDEIKTLKAPVDVNLPSVPTIDQEKLAQSNAYKDSENNVAVLTLNYFEELQAAQEKEDAARAQLNQSQQNAQVLQQQLTAARAQLHQCMQSQQELDQRLPDLQSQLDDCLEERKNLEEQISNLQADTTSDQSDVIKKLRKELHASLKDREACEGDLIDMQIRHDQLQLNERNLRTELSNVREQLRKAQQDASTNTDNRPTTAPAGDKSQSLQAELDLYREELTTLQKLWNDLQTQHVQLQLQREAEDHEGCKAEKADLEQKLDDANKSIKVLQMKVIADPGKLQPAIIELEAQRDVARQQRDKQREDIKELEKQLKKQKMDCETEKNELQARINQLSEPTRPIVMYRSD